MDLKNVPQVGGGPEAPGCGIYDDDPQMRIRMMEEARRAQVADASVETSKKVAKAGVLAFLTRHFKGLIVALLAVVAVAAVCLTVYQSRANASKPNTIVTSSTLKDTLNIGELNVARSTYDGIATKEKDGIFGSDTHVYYRASIVAKADMSQIEIDNLPDEPNDEGKITIVIHLPQITLDDVVPTDPEFFEDGKTGSIGEIYQLCKDDCSAGVRNNEQLMKTAQENLERTIQALTEPLLEDGKYEIVYVQGEGASDAQE